MWNCYYIVSTWSNFNKTHIILMSILNFQACYIPPRYRCPIKKNKHRLGSTDLEPRPVKYVALLLALPIPHTLLAVGSAWESSHSVSNCKSQRLSFWVSELELRSICYKRSKSGFPFSRSDHIGPPSCVHY